MLRQCKLSPRTAFVTLADRCRNWAVAMFGGVVILASLWYVLAGSKSYTSPVSKVQHTD